RIEKLDDNLYQVFALAQMWSFEPNEIFLPVGAEVDIYLTSKDVVHGYHINDVSLNMMAVPGGVNKKTVTFKKPGVYKIVCHEYCGSGHQHMLGEIIVNHPTNRLDHVKNPPSKIREEAFIHFIDFAPRFADSRNLSRAHADLVSIRDDLSDL